MGSTQAGVVLRHIRGLAAARRTAEVSDGQLLERFLRRREEQAFAALVKRHGPLVLGVCRRVLHNRADAEDAFQATFLVLARRAASISRQGSVGSWLYKVAYHMAVRARKQSAIRQRREHKAAAPLAASPPDPLAEVTGRELLTVLDEELQRLPERHRAPLVLCYLQGRTRDEAARQLGYSPSTLERRLNEGKARLHARLTRRGLALSAALLAAGVTQCKAAVPASLARTAVQSVSLLAAGHALSTPAVSLANGALRAMGAGKLKIAVALVFAVAFTALGAAALGRGSLAQPQAEAAAPAQAPEKDKAPAVKPGAGVETGRMVVSGRVLDADGKPIPGAQAAVLAWRKRLPRAGGSPEGNEWLGQGQADQAGNFRLDVPRTSSALFYYLQVVAVAPGHAVGWAEVSPDAEQPETTVRLGHEQLLRGRLVDLQGEPAAKAKLRVAWVSRKVGQQGHGVSAPAGDVAAWPGSLTTDEQGRFALRGVAADQEVWLDVADPRYACQYLEIPTTHKGRGGEITFPLQPPHVLHGRVTCADTGKPVAGARLMVMAIGRNFTGQADADGRYELPISPSKWVGISATPPGGTPYLTLKHDMEWPKGVARHAVDLKLPRGVLVTGTVTEAGSGKPVAGANVQFFPEGAGESGLSKEVAVLWRGAVASGPDGKFRIAVLPGKGHLLIRGPTPDYLFQEVAYGVLVRGKPDYGSYFLGPEGNAFYGGQRIYVHGLVPLDLKEKDEPKPVQVALRRGVTVRGRLLDVDGKPVGHAWMLSRLLVSTTEHIVQLPEQIHGGRFELRGGDPEATYRVIFLDAVHKQGTVVEIAGKQAGDEPVTVRLKPCGTATARLMRGGQPIPKVRVGFDLIVTPGPGPGDPKGLMADQVWISQADGVNYMGGPRTDNEGRLTLPALVPGVTYRFKLQQGWKDFVAEAGKTVDWGDIVDPVVFAESP